MYQNDPEWQKLQKKADNAFKLLYVLFGITLVAFMTSFLIVIIQLWPKSH